jgi:hypothetical protein
VAQSLQRRISVIQALPRTERPDAWQRLIVSLEQERQSATELEHRHAVSLWLFHVQRLMAEDEMSSSVRCPRSAD